jgi:hypothetical protein
VDADAQLGAEGRRDPRQQIDVDMRSHARLDPPNLSV